MRPSKHPKVILFDLGGVCVGSPFQAILDYEQSHGIPQGWINHSISKAAPDGYWQRLETGRIPLDASFFAGFSRDLCDAARWRAFHHDAEPLPPPPVVDGERLFRAMMAAAAHPDPWVLPALQRLHADGRYIIAALSNTVIIPPGDVSATPYREDDPVRGLFDVFVSSAHVGVRKPDPRIYQLALERVDQFAKGLAETKRGVAGRWVNGVEPGEILFLDDIGENLKAARSAGFQTIKVPLGRAFEAVERLEQITELKLAGDHPKVPIKSGIRAPRPKI